MIRGRLRRRQGGDAPEPPAEDYVEIDATELTGVLSTPTWLRDLGITAWLLVGVALFLVGAVWLLALTATIVTPVITAGVVASVASPLVGWLARHGVPRAAGAALLLVAIFWLAIGVVVVVVGGITSQTDGLRGHLSDAKARIEDWLIDIGVDTSEAGNTVADASSTASDGVSALIHGLGVGIATLSSLVFFLSLTALSLFFLLKDGPTIRAWSERHLGVPQSVAKVVSKRTLESMRGYFLGVTLVAGFNAVVVFIGALILGVPLAGTIAAITFLAGFVPYLGAWTAGAFSVLVALGSVGVDAAAGMIVVQLLANGILQQLVQPFAMGAALGIHPLAVLIVTIAGGALFGAVGLILAAPLTAAAAQISGDLARARAAEAGGEPAAAG